MAPVSTGMALATDDDDDNDLSVAKIRGHFLRLSYA